MKIFAGNLDRFLSCDIAPSHRFKVDKLWDVFSTIFGFDLVTFPDVNRFMKSLKKTEFPEGTYNSSSIKYLDMYNDLDADIVNKKELSLYPILALLAGSISNELKVLLKSHLLVEFGFNFVPNKSYAIDGAAIVKRAGPDSTFTTTHALPLILYQLKLQVSSSLDDQEIYNLSEFFIQAYYLATVYNHKFWHCLTDMIDFHYFQYQLNEGNLEIQNYHYLNTKDFTLTDHQKHVLKVVNLFADI